MSEKRTTSADTVPIDRDELLRQLEKVKADMPEPEPAYPDDLPTNPSLDMTRPPCTWCDGVGELRGKTCLHCNGTKLEPLMRDSEP